MTNFFIASENGVRDSFSLVSAENTCSFLFWSVRSFRRLSARLSSRAIASERPWKLIYRSHIFNSDQCICLTPKQMTKLRIDLATLTSPRRSKLQWAARIILRTSASSHTSNTYTHCGSCKLPQSPRDVYLHGSFQYSLSSSVQLDLSLCRWRVSYQYPWWLH